MVEGDVLNPVAVTMGYKALNFESGVQCLARVGQLKIFD